MTSVTRCQGVFLHSSGCVVSLPLVCRLLAAWSKWSREALSDQELPIIVAALSASESLPCTGNALSSARLIRVDRDLFFGGSGCPLLGVKRTSFGHQKEWPRARQGHSSVQTAVLSHLVTLSGHQAWRSPAITHLQAHKRTSSFPLLAATKPLKTSLTWSHDFSLFMLSNQRLILG